MKKFDSLLEPFEIFALFSLTSIHICDENSCLLVIHVLFSKTA